MPQFGNANNKQRADYPEKSNTQRKSTLDTMQQPAQKPRMARILFLVA
jgi:hypothetical protein